MSSEGKTERRTPYYQDVDGFRIPGIFSAKAYRSAIQYKPRPDDLFIVTFPKCGTTWMQNIVTCIYNEGRPISTVMEYLIQTPFLEMAGAEAAENMKRPGPLKVHLPFRLTPYSPEAKYIFIARNPKDCCVSFYYHTKNISGYRFTDGLFDDFFELFINGQTDFGDYFDTLLSWYEHRNDTNVLFLTYEELKRDTETNLKRIAAFMGEKYKVMLESNPDLLSEIMKNVSFGGMRQKLGESFVENKNLSPEEMLKLPDMTEGLRTVFANAEMLNNDQPALFRKGIVGDWRNHFSEDQNARLEAKFYERTKGTDIPNLWKESM